ncbi:MAG TPA: NAD(P)/FAD-dependent oxidoreductase [Bryobacteraceae bacterium]|nr:NAD(P)/FAD-dependent oxidoreductase [Bryobacteraceae bacterium]
MPEGRVHDAIVIGGGLAGLAAGCTLLEAGLDCLVLEAAGYAGGRARTIHYGDLYAEAGAMVFTGEEQETLALLRRYSNAPLMELGTHGAELSLGGRLLRMGRMDGRAGGWRDLVDLLRLAGAMRAAGAEGFPKPTLRLLTAHRRFVRAVEKQAADISYPYRPDAAEGWDDTSFAAFARSFDARLTPILDLQLKVTAGELSDRISRFWGLVTSHWNADRFYWLSGGTSRFPEALAAVLGSRFVKDCRVEAVEQGEPLRIFARLGDRADSFACRQAIVAATPRAAAGMVRGLPDWKRAALEAVPFGAYIAVHLLCAERFWSRSILSGYLNCAGTTCADMVDGTKGQPGKRGILIGFVAGPEARRLLEASDEQIVARVAGDVQKIFPGGESKIERGFVYRWPEGIPYFPPGYAATLQALRESWGAIHFCGDYTQGAGMHDAVLSGLLAAERVTQALNLALRLPRPCRAVGTSL